jgi:O-antigen/teichoic acid export membrane protein
VARLVGAVLSFVKVPLLLHGLGVTNYGVWVAVFGIVQYGSMADLGLQYAVVQKVAEKRGSGREGEIPGLVSTAFWLVGVTAVVLALLVGILVTFWDPMASWAHGSIDAARLDLVLFGGVAGVLLVQPSRVVHAAQMGHERFAALNVIQIFSAVAQFLGLYIAIELRPGDLLSVTLWIVTWDLVTSYGVAAWLVAQSKGRFSLSPVLVTVKRMKEVIRSAAGFFLGTLANSVWGAVDAIAILSIAGADAVPRFSTANALFLSGLTIAPLVAGSLWPAYTEAAARKDWDWLERVFKRTSLILMSVAAMGAILAAVLGPDFIYGWVGQDAFGGRGLIWLLAGWFVSEVWRQNVQQMVVALGRNDLIVRWRFAEGFAKILLTVWLVSEYGPVGAAAASLIAVLGLGVLPATLLVPILTRRQVTVPLMPFVRLGVVGFGLFLAGQLSWSFLWDEPVHLYVTVGSGFAAAAPIAMAMWAFVLDREDRVWIKGVLWAAR